MQLFSLFASRSYIYRSWLLPLFCLTILFYRYWLRVFSFCLTISFHRYWLIHTTFSVCLTISFHRYWLIHAPFLWFASRSHSIVIGSESYFFSPHGLIYRYWLRFVFLLLPEKKQTSKSSIPVAREQCKTPPQFHNNRHTFNGRHASKKVLCPDIYSYI